MASPQSVPSGCRHCGIGERLYFSRWTDKAGWHTFVEPTKEQVVGRMKARRVVRIVIPVDSAFADLAYDRITNGEN